MEKNILLSEIVMAAKEYLDNPTGEENIKNLNEIKSKIIIKSFLPLYEKESVLLRMGYEIDDSFGEEANSLACTAELVLIIEGIVAYSSIENDLGDNYKLSLVYDTLINSGMVDFILDNCQKDFNRLEAMYRQMISFDNIHRLIDTFKDVDTEAMEECLMHIEMLQNTMDKEALKDIIAMAKENNPELKKLQKMLQTEASLEARKKEVK